jgi:hypothetical protein
MTETEERELQVERGTVECRPGVRVGLDRCRFCASSRAFRERGSWKRSPALAYCMASRVTEEVDLANVGAVRCADRTGEGFRSIMSIIS